MLLERKYNKNDKIRVLLRNGNIKKKLLQNKALGHCQIEKKKNPRGSRKYSQALPWHIFNKISKLPPESRLGTIADWMIGPYFSSILPSLHPHSCCDLSWKKKTISFLDLGFSLFFFFFCQWYIDWNHSWPISSLASKKPCRFPTFPLGLLPATR